MTTYSVSVDTDYSELVGITDGDIIDMQGDATLTISQTTSEIDIYYCNNLSRAIRLANSNINTPIFMKSQNSSSSFNLGGGNFIVRGEWITLGTSDGTPNQVFDLPVDASGERYEEIAHVKVGSSNWGRVNDMSNDFGDERGKVFTHDTTATGINLGGQISFGDDTNGKIPPLGETVKVANIQYKSNNAQMNLSGGTLDWEKFLVSGKPDWRTGGKWLFNDVGVYDPQQALVADDFSSSSINDFVISGDTYNTRFSITAGSHGEILFISDSNDSNEVLTDQNRPYTVTKLTAMFRSPRNSSFSRVRLNLSESTIDEMFIWSGDDVSISFGDKSNGTIGTLTYSTRALRNQVVLYGIYLAALECSNMTINNLVHYGDESQSEILRPIRNIAGVNLKLSNWETPSDFSAGRLLEVAQGASFIGENWVINGTISDTGARDINTFSNLRVTLKNIIMPDETDCGNQASVNMNWEVMYLVGNIPSIGRNTRSITTRSNNTGTQGYIGLQPYYDENDPATSLVSGVGSSYLFTMTRFHLSDTVTEIEIETNIIGGVISIDSYSVGGSNTSHFHIIYDMRTASGSYSGGFLEMNEFNLQSSLSALVGYDSDKGLVIKYRVRKTQGGISSTRIEGIVIGCTFDPTFRVSTLGEMLITFNNLTIGDYIRIQDDAGDTQFYKQVSSTTETFEIDGINEGETWAYVVARKGYSPNKGSFEITTNTNLIIPVSLNRYFRAGGQAMYTDTNSNDVSVVFDLLSPLAIIDIEDIQVSPQAIFDKFERALVTEIGMAWHYQQESVCKHDDLPGLGLALFTGDNIRVRRANSSYSNSGVQGHIENTQKTPVDGSNGDVSFVGGINSELITLSDTIASLVTETLELTQQTTRTGDILEGDEQFRPESYTKLLKGTSQVLLRKSVTRDGNDSLDLTEEP